MTIRKGESWGERSIPPAGLAVAASDSEAAELVRRGCREFLLTGGDLWRTLGGSSPENSRVDSLVDVDDVRTVVPVDCLWASWSHDGIQESRPVFAHAIVRFRHRRWSRRRGDLCYVMNAQFLGAFDVAPRSHPNDGRFDVLTVDGSMTWRQRQLLRRRLLTGTHLPHPSIRTESVMQWWSPEGPSALVLDGEHFDGGSEICVTIRPDSLRIWF